MLSLRHAAVRTATSAHSVARQLLGRPSSVFLSTSTEAAGTDMEEHIAGLLREQLKATTVEVTDISGGCGSMYKIHVESPEFAGKGLVAQQRMVNTVLKTEIANMHGLTLSTRVPK